MHFAAILTLVFPLYGFAQRPQANEVKEAQERLCVEQLERRTSALVARDWSQLVAEADTYIRKCGSALGADELSRAHEHLVTAHIFLKMPKRALKSADHCLRIYYGNVGCHVGRAETLIDLERLSEARMSLDRADRLAAAGIERLDREMRSPQHPADREVAKSRSYELKASQELAAALRDQIEVLEAFK